MAEVKDDNDMFRPLNEEQAEKLMASLTKREDKAMEEGLN